MDSSPQHDPTNPFSDGALPADADFAPAGSDDAAAHPAAGEDTAATTGNDVAEDDLGTEDTIGDDNLHGETLVGGTGDGGSDPDALVRGGRVATAEDME